MTRVAINGFGRIGRNFFPRWRSRPNVTRSTQRLRQPRANNEWGYSCRLVDLVELISAKTQ
jgi:glyceraldehyde-3-phosphate dehydrogenase/erythrose-4-phosphate dehydrogenase